MPIQPDGGSLHVNAPLTNVSVAYLQDNDVYVADKVFPRVPVSSQGNLFWKYDRASMMRVVAAERAPGTESAGGGWKMDQDSYFTKVVAVHLDVDDQTKAAADSVFNLDADAARYCTEQLHIKRDSDFAAKFLRPGVWTGGTGLNGGNNGEDIKGGNAAGDNTVVFWDKDGSDPINDIADQILGQVVLTGKRPNTLVVGPFVHKALLHHPEVIERIKYSEKGIASEDLLKSLFGVERYLVTWAVENIAEEGQDANYALQNGKSALLAYTTKTPGLKQVSAGYVFVWTGLLGAGAFGGRIKKFRIEEKASDRVEAEMAYDMKVVAADVAIFFDNIVS